MEDAFQELLDLGNRIKKRDRLSILAAVIGVVVTILLYGTPFFGIGLLICAAALIVMFVTNAKLGKQYRELYKKTMIDRVAREYFSQYEYLPKIGFQKDYLRSLGIMSFGSDFWSEDTIKGVYNNVSFTRADVYIADTSTDSDGNSLFSAKLVIFSPEEHAGVYSDHPADYLQNTVRSMFDGSGEEIEMEKPRRGGRPRKRAEDGTK